MFAFETKVAKILDAHPRRGKSEDAAPYVVVRMEVVGLSANTMAATAGVNDPVQFDGAFWLTGEDLKKEPRLLGLHHRTKYKAEGLHFLKLGGRSRIRVDRLFGVSFETGQPGYYDASFSVAIDLKDDSTTLEYLKSRINKETSCTLICEGDDLFTPRVPPQAEVTATIENGDLLDSDANKARADAIGEALEAGESKPKRKRSGSSKKSASFRARRARGRK